MGNSLYPFTLPLYPISLKRSPRNVRRIVELEKHGLVAVTARDKFVRIYSLGTGRQVKRIRAHRKFAKDIAVIDKDYLLSVGSDCTARLWRVDDWRLVDTLTLPDWGVSCAALGKRRVVIGTGLTGKLLEIEVAGTDSQASSDNSAIDMRLLRVIDTTGGWVDQVRVHGHRVLTAQLHGCVQLWEKSTLAPICTLSNGSDMLHDGAVSAALNATYMATGAADSTVRIYDTENAELRHTIQREVGWPKSQEFVDRKNLLCATTKELLLIDALQGVVRWQFGWDCSFTCVRVLSGNRIAVGTARAGIAVFELGQLVKFE